MESLFSARFLTFDQQSWTQPTSLRYAAELVRDGKVAAVLLDIVPDEALGTWWLDSAPTGETTATAQASRFTQLFVEEISAERRTFNGWNRFMLAVKHAYPLVQGAAALATGPVWSGAPSSSQLGLASVGGGYGDDDAEVGAAPIVDSRMLSAGVEQLAAFLTIRPGTYSRGMTLWNRRSAPVDAGNPWSQPDNRGPQLAHRPSIPDGGAPLTIRPTAGQLCLFNSAYQHAWETARSVGTAGSRPPASYRRSLRGASRAATARLAIHSFLIHSHDGWTLLN